jgi:hypothetical protein
VETTLSLQGISLSLTIAALISFLCVSVPVSGAAVNLAQDQTSAIANLYAALNAHDVNGAITLFADDAILDDPFHIVCPTVFVHPTCGLMTSNLESAVPYVGRVQIRGWLEWLIGQNIHVGQISDLHVAGLNASWFFVISLDRYRRLGIDQLSAYAQSLIQDGKFRVLAIGLTSESLSKLQASAARQQQRQLSIVAGGLIAGLLTLPFIIAVGLGAVWLERRMLLRAGDKNRAHKME